MFTKNQLRYGKTDPLPQQISLRAGPLNLLYENGDLRSIKYRECELVRRIYVAVRDRNWGTILPVFSNINLNIAIDCFEIAFEVKNELNDIHFTWQGLIRGESDGAITFHMEGQAITTFLKNRIGCCVLHPAGLAGKRCSITHIDDSRDVTVFPSMITSDQPPLPFTDMHGLSYMVDPVKVDITFDGDVFEMEDQRNWTDASFKTYSTPLRFPYPVEIISGTKINQTIAMRTCRINEETHINPNGESGMTLELSSRLLGGLPALGTGLASDAEVFSPDEITRLKALQLSHLRADVWLSDPLYRIGVRNAVDQSNILNVPLYLALHISENGEAEIRDFQQILHEFRLNVTLWLVYPTKEFYLGGSPTAQVVAWVRNSEITKLSQSLVSGTDNDFIFLQRNPPPFEQLDGVCFAINPQVHAFDNASIMETLEAQVMAVSSAIQLSGGQPVIVSPVTLRPRHNPYATGELNHTWPGELPPQVDYRQPSLFTAAWLVGSLRAMTEGGASAITYFETIGWRGLMETNAGSPVTGKFYSIPGAVFPVYHVFADIAELSPGYPSTGIDILTTITNDALKIQGLAMRKKDHLRLLVANLSPKIQTVLMGRLPDYVNIRFLDETNVEKAMRTPEAYRSKSMVAHNTSSGRLELELLPYAVVTIDCN